MVLVFLSLMRSTNKPDYTQMLGQRPAGTQYSGMAYERPSVDRSVCFGPGITQGQHLMAGEIQQFKLFAFTAQGTPCVPIAPGTIVNVLLQPQALASGTKQDPAPTVIDLGDGSFDVRYIVTNPGKYDISLRIDGLEITTLETRVLEFMSGRAFHSTSECEGL